MASNFGKTMMSLSALTVIGGVIGVGGLYYWAANPQWSEELNESGWIKPHAHLEEPLRNSDMAAVFAEAQRAGELSQPGSRERRTDHYTDDGLVTLTDSDIELLNERFKARAEPDSGAVVERGRQSDIEQEGLSDAGWGSDTTF